MSEENGIRPANQVLLPCPFCGGEGYDDKELRGPAYENDQEDPDAWAYFVRCRSCAAQGPWVKSSVNGGRSCWNRQSEIASLKSQLAEAQKDREKLSNLTSKLLRAMGKP